MNLVISRIISHARIIPGKGPPVQIVKEYNRFASSPPSLHGWHGILHTLFPFAATVDDLTGFRPVANYKHKLNWSLLGGNCLYLCSEFTIRNSRYV